MRTIEIPVYTAKELKEVSPTGFERAKESFVEDNNSFDQCTLSEFKEKLSILGFDGANCFYSGFWNQGDGASWAGNWVRKPDLEKLADEFPTDEVAKKLGEFLAALPESSSFRVRRNEHRYSHEYTMYVDSSDSDVEIDDSAVIEECRALAKSLYRALEADYEAESTDEHFLDTSDANNWEYYSDGRMV
jgi:hypothetical protein